jgi:hypothetical protein
MMLTADDGRAIAKKLGATVEDDAKKHEKVSVWFHGRMVARYGIRRASREKSHNYISRELHISQSQTKELAACRITSEAYFQMILDGGFI